MSSRSQPARPFRFSASAGKPVSGRRLPEEARRAEFLGYSALVLSDQLNADPIDVPAPVVERLAGS